MNLEKLGRVLFLGEAETPKVRKKEKKRIKTPRVKKKGSRRPKAQGKGGAPSLQRWRKGGARALGKRGTRSPKL